MHRMHLLVLLLLVSAPLHAGNVIARAYSDFIHSLAYSVTSTHRDMLGVELESKYKDQPVTFQYQLWRLRKDSVCAQLKHNLLEYSKCTRAARALFTQTCRHLTNNPINFDSLSFSVVVLHSDNQTGYKVSEKTPKGHDQHE